MHSSKGAGLLRDSQQITVIISPLWGTLGWDTVLYLQMGILGRHGNKLTLQPQCVGHLPVCPQTPLSVSSLRCTTMQKTTVPRLPCPLTWKQH